MPLSSDYIARYALTLRLRYCIAGNFPGRKLLQTSWFCGYSQKLGAWCPLAWHKRTIHESFLRKNHVFHPPSKVSRYIIDCMTVTYTPFMWKL